MNKLRNTVISYLIFGTNSSEYAIALTRVLSMRVKQGNASANIYADGCRRLHVCTHTRRTETRDFLFEERKIRARVYSQLRVRAHLSVKCVEGSSIDRNVTEN